MSLVSMSLLASVLRLAGSSGRLTCRKLAHRCSFRPVAGRPDRPQYSDVSRLTIRSEASQLPEDASKPRADGADASAGSAHPEAIPSAATRAAPPTASAASTTPRYDAFISYSHAADGALAPAVQHGLQALAKPLYQRRALRIFRDQTSLAVTPALWPTIQQALEASQYFILLASPAAAQSPWVRQELAWWMQHTGNPRPS
jgi:hypothetical protein